MWLLLAASVVAADGTAGITNAVSALFAVPAAAAGAACVGELWLLLADASGGGAAQGACADGDPTSAGDGTVVVITPCWYAHSSSNPYWC